jgi:hypothetical protein
MMTNWAKPVSRREPPAAGAGCGAAGGKECGIACSAFLPPLLLSRPGSPAAIPLLENVRRRLERVAVAESSSLTANALDTIAASEASSAFKKCNATATAGRGPRLECSRRFA